MFADPCTLRRATAITVNYQRPDYLKTLAKGSSTETTFNIEIKIQQQTKKLNQQTDLRFFKKKLHDLFLGQKFYTLKVRKLPLFLLKEKKRKCIYISHFSSFFVRI